MRDWLQNRFDNFRLAKQIAVQWRDDEGVTLIELMAVVVILGIIAAVAIPVVTGAISQAKVNTTETNLGTLQQALQRYAADHGQYPSSLTALDQQTNSQGQLNQSGQQYGPYLTTGFPENDSWGNPIYYAPVPSATSKPITGYVLISGDGSPVTFGSGTTSTSESKPSSNTGFIYASGGISSNGNPIAAGPTVYKSSTTTPSQLPTSLSLSSSSSSSSPKLNPNNLTYSDN